MFQYQASCLRILSIAALAAVIVAGGSVRGSVPPAAAANQRHRAVKPPPEDPTASFQSFCKQWMEKVWGREGQNSSTWERDGDGVVRSYVEYSRDYNCTVTEEKPPVGKITYRETWYERRGKTAADAEASPPEPIKIFETSEYFSYNRGKWLY